MAECGASVLPAVLPHQHTPHRLVLGYPGCSGAASAPPAPGTGPTAAAACAWRGVSGVRISPALVSERIHSVLALPPLVEADGLAVLGHLVQHEVVHRTAALACTTPCSCASSFATPPPLQQRADAGGHGQRHRARHATSTSPARLPAPRPSPPARTSTSRAPPAPCRPAARPAGHSTSIVCCITHMSALALGVLQAAARTRRTARPERGQGQGQGGVDELRGTGAVALNRPRKCHPRQHRRPPPPACSSAGYDAQKAAPTRWPAHCLMSCFIVLPRRGRQRVRRLAQHAVRELRQRRALQGWEAAPG